MRVNSIFIFLSLSFALTSHAYETKQVSFKSNGNKLSGTLYLPDGHKQGLKYPGVIVTGAWTTVKEQMPKTYAIEMANRGYIALTFDFNGWGESEGKIRYLEDPESKTVDIIQAAEFLATRPEVNSTKISGIGICASSGYMADAYTRSKKIRSVALIAPWLHTPQMATQVYGGSASVKKLLAAADDAKANFEKTGKPTLAIAASASDKSSIMYKAPYYTEEKRGLIKEYDNKFNIASWRTWLTYDAMKSASKLPGKILFVGSEAMALPKGAEQYENLANGKVEKVWLKGVSQFDFYDKLEPVKKAADSAVQHFRKHVQ